MENNTDPLPFTFDIPAYDKKLAKRPSSFVGIPEEFLVLIGHVVGAWSKFDSSFNDLLGKFLVASSIQKKKWHLKSFKDRSSLFKRTCNVLFVGNETILNAVEQIISDAKDLQTDRNLISHGHITLKVQTFEAVDNKIPGKVSLHCTGHKAGKVIEREYAYEELEKVRYELAFLCGRMNALLGGENLNKLQITQPDIDALQAILAQYN